MELLKVDTIEEAMEKLLVYAAGAVSLDLEGSCRTGLPMETEDVPLMQLLGRVLAEDVISEEAVPGFNRSTMDGYAVRSSDTGGASESMPSFLKVVGEVEMGCDASGLITSTLRMKGKLLPIYACLIVALGWTRCRSVE